MAGLHWAQLQSAIAKFKQNLQKGSDVIWIFRVLAVATCKINGLYLSLPLVHPPFCTLHPAQRHIFEYAIRLDYTPPPKVLLRTQTIMTLMFAVTKIQTMPVLFVVIMRGLLHRREELPLQRKGHNIHDDFAVAILLLSVMYHRLVFPAEERQRDDLYRRRQW